jgi:hypothetical protein
MHIRGVAILDSDVLPADNHLHRTEVAIWDEVHCFKKRAHNRSSYHSCDPFVCKHVHITGVAILDSDALPADNHLHRTEVAI